MNGNWNQHLCLLIVKRSSNTKENKNIQVGSLQLAHTLHQGGRESSPVSPGEVGGTSNYLQLSILRCVFQWFGHAIATAETWKHKHYNINTIAKQAGGFSLIAKTLPGTSLRPLTLLELGNHGSCTKATITYSSRNLFARTTVAALACCWLS